MLIAAAGCLAFDFRRNAARIAEHLEVAGHFLAVGRFARERNFQRVFIDVLFSATELMAKGMLIWKPDESLLTSKKHEYTRVRFNRAGHHGNVDARFVALLNRLAALRTRARYLAGEIDLSDSEMDEMLYIASEMHDTLDATSPKRASVEREC